MPTMSHTTNMRKTKLVEGRRTLAFTSMRQVLSDAQSFGAAGPSQALGNWTAGQIVDHVAILIDYSVEGFPPDANPGWLAKLIGPFFKTMLTEKSMKPGFTLPAKMSALLPKIREWGPALAHLERSIAAFERSSDFKPSPFVGPLTREEWTKLHLRHAELHFSFMK